uniref:Uncharacterized protein n=1 Tax=Rhizophora mucronata TaxID=61149 RepID=A0A2P2J1N3_RHIMU
MAVLNGIQRLVKILSDYESTILYPHKQLTSLITKDKLNPPIPNSRHKQLTSLITKDKLNPPIPNSRHKQLTSLITKDKLNPPIPNSRLKEHYLKAIFFERVHKARYSTTTLQRCLFISELNPDQLAHNKVSK